MPDLSPWCAPNRTSAGASELWVHTLIVMDQHPADRGQPDDDGDRDRPGADADVTDGLPVGFILRDLAIPCLVISIRIAHGLPPLLHFRP
jgi:hypothetical protein